MIIALQKIMAGAVQRGADTPEGPVTP